MKKQLFYS